MIKKKVWVHFKSPKVLFLEMRRAQHDMRAWQKSDDLHRYMILFSLSYAEH